MKNISKIRQAENNYLDESAKEIVLSPAEDAALRDAFTSFVHHNLQSTIIKKKHLLSRLVDCRLGPQVEKRFLTLFDSGNSNGIRLSHFLMLSTLLLKGTLEIQLYLIYKSLDVDGDGDLKDSDLFRLLSTGNVVDLSPADDLTFGFARTELLRGIQGLNLGGSTSSSPPSNSSISILSPFTSLARRALMKSPPPATSVLSSSKNQFVSTSVSFEAFLEVVTEDLMESLKLSNVTQQMLLASTDFLTSLSVGWLELLMKVNPGIRQAFNLNHIPHSSVLLKMKPPSIIDNDYHKSSDSHNQVASNTSSVTGQKRIFEDNLLVGVINGPIVFNGVLIHPNSCEKTLFGNSLNPTCVNDKSNFHVPSSAQSVGKKIMLPITSLNASTSNNQSPISQHHQAHPVSPLSSPSPQYINSNSNNNNNNNALSQNGIQPTANLALPISRTGPLSTAGNHLLSPSPSTAVSLPPHNANINGTNNNNIAASNIHFPISASSTYSNNVDNMDSVNYIVIPGIILKENSSFGAMGIPSSATSINPTNSLTGAQFSRTYNHQIHSFNNTNSNLGLNGPVNSNLLLMNHTSKINIQKAPLFDRGMNDYVDIVDGTNNAQQKNNSEIHGDFG